MRKEIEGIQEGLKWGDAASVRRALRGIESSLRATETALDGCTVELSSLRESYRSVKAERDELEQMCNGFREWFKQQGVVAPMTTSGEAHPIPTPRAGAAEIA